MCPITTELLARSEVSNHKKWLLSVDIVLPESVSQPIKFSTSKRAVEIAGIFNVDRYSLGIASCCIGDHASPHISSAIQQLGVNQLPPDEVMSP